MKFNYTYFLSIVLLLLGFTSCSDETNIDPNRPPIVTTTSLVITSEKMLTDNLRDETVSLRGSMLFAQYFAQNSYTAQSRYEMPFSYSDGYWKGLYTALNNLDEIIRLNTDPQTRDRVAANGEGRNSAQIAVSRILKTYAFYALTDMFGNVPYQSYGNPDPDFQALQHDPENITPKYASQEKIYRDMLNELKAASDTLLKYSSESTFSTGDILYGKKSGGNNQYWAKFANSLRLRFATRFKGKDDALYRSHFADALSKGVFTSNADNAVFTYSSIAPNQAPYYKATVTANRRDFAVSHVFINLLKGENPQLPLADPRLSIYASVNNQNEYVGLPYGLNQSEAGNFSALQVSLPGAALIVPNFGEVLMEYAEVAFLISEYEGWSQDKYEAGVRASLAKWGVPAANADAYVAALPKANEQNVLNQKYLALYTQGLEAWSEYRRTGYPNFLVTSGDVIYKSPTNTFIFEPLFGDGGIPSRLYYPQKEQNVNIANYQQALSEQGRDRIETRLWIFK